MGHLVTLTLSKYANFQQKSSRTIISPVVMDFLLVVHFLQNTLLLSKVWFNFAPFFNSCMNIFGGALHHLPIIIGIIGGALHHVYPLHSGQKCVIYSHSKIKPQNLKFFDLSKYCIIFTSIITPSSIMLFGVIKASAICI